MLNNPFLSLYLGKRAQETRVNRQRDLVYRSKAFLKHNVSAKDVTPTVGLKSQSKGMLVLPDPYTQSGMGVYASRCVAVSTVRRLVTWVHTSARTGVCMHACTRHTISKYTHQNITKQILHLKYLLRRSFSLVMCRVRTL